MPERNHEVIIDSYVYPDVVTVTLSNDDFIGSRDYVGKERYESVIEANAAWQGENDRLRELVREYDKVLDAAVDVWGIMADALGYGRKYDALHDRMRELGIEVER